MDADIIRSAELENAAEEVEEARQYLIDLDRRQNQYREANRVLKKSPVTGDLWLLSSGGVFVKSELRHSETLRHLSWRMNAGEREIQRVREELKRKVAHLAELEGPHQPLAHLMKGFELKATTCHQ